LKNLIVDDETPKYKLVKLIIAIKKLSRYFDLYERCRLQCIEKINEISTKTNVNVTGSALLPDISGAVIAQKPYEEISTITIVMLDWRRSTRGYDQFIRGLQMGLPMTIYGKPLQPLKELIARSKKPSAVLPAMTIVKGLSGHLDKA